MKKPLEIEYVCTGNGGRSPMCETIGKDDIALRELEERVTISSSGSAVDDVMNLRFPMSELIQYIEIGLKSGTYKGKSLALAKFVVDNRSDVELEAEEGDKGAKMAIEHCLKYLMADEVAKRNMVLLEQGLVPEGHFHQQTVARPNVLLILTMKESNADQVRKIYAPTAYKPIIAPICDYAGLEGAISDPFGREIEVWRQTRNSIAEAVKKSIDKAVQEYL